MLINNLYHDNHEYFILLLQAALKDASSGNAYSC